jgi:hypothetical protein
MRFLVFALAVIVALFAGNESIAYERRTHQNLTRDAVLSSVLADESRRAKLGIRWPVGSTREQFANSKKIRLTPLDLVVLGSDYEDDFPPGPIFHFFDPTTRSPLHLEAADYPGGELFVLAMNAVTGPSPNWAIAGDSGTSLLGNVYSFAKARDYFYASTTASLGAERDGNRAKLFESLGRIVHHVEDMAQPQHVRNDNHLSDNHTDFLCKDRWWTGNGNALLICNQYKSLRRFSLYESWTDRLDIGELPTAGYAPVYPDRDATPDGVASFPNAEAFWTNAGKGMADYTNRNFLSENTLLREPPILDGVYDVDLRTLCTGAQPPCADFPGPWPADEYVTFYTSVVDDRLRPETGLISHPFASSASIFDAEFQVAGEQRVTGLNRFTFAFDHKLLLPRAVGYSAGLINYFFRGEIAVAPPDENVYAVADASSGSCQPVCGFTKLKMKLRNATYRQEMGPGTLIAVARYWRNRCYSTDLSGDYGGPGFQGSSCRDKIDTVSVSIPVTIQRLDSTQLVPMEFTFDAMSPIPFGISDLDVQVVFRGKLGAEDDAVAVSTVDVGETQYFAVGNITDWAFDDMAATPVWLPVGPLTPLNASYAINDIALSLADPAAAGRPLATIDSLGAGRHAQLAFLPPAPADSEKYHFWLTTSAAGNNSYPPEQNVGVPVDEFKLREGPPDTYGTICPVTPERGVYRQVFRYYSQIVHHQVGAKDASTTSVVKSEAAAGKLSPADCWHAPPAGSGGFWDLSVMVPRFAPANEARWTVNF